MILRVEVPFNRLTPKEVKEIKEYFNKHYYAPYGFKSHDVIRCDMYEGLHGQEPSSGAIIGLVNDMMILTDYFRFYVVFPSTELTNVELARIYDGAIDREGDACEVKRRYEFQIGGDGPNDQRAYLKIYYEKEIKK